MVTSGSSHGPTGPGGVTSPGSAEGGGPRVGDADGPSDGDADGLADGDGPGVTAGPWSPDGGSGTTSGPVTSGGTPLGGKTHAAGMRPPPNAVPKASTIDAGHHSPWYPLCGRPSG